MQFDHPSNFQITCIRQSMRNRAMRMAVLYPLLGRWLDDKNKEATDRSIIEAMSQLRRIWHARLIELREVGWTWLRQSRNFTRVWNCPPFGVNTSSSYKYRCDRRMLCPFCYARSYVLKIFSLFERTLYVDRKPTTKPEKEGWTLVSFSVRDSVAKPKRSRTWDTAALREICRKLRTDDISSHDLRKSMFLKCAGKFGVTQWQVEPKEHRLLIRRNGLLLTRKLVRLEEIKTREQDYVGIDNLSTLTEIKKTLAVACAKVFAYPRGLLYGDAMETVTILESLARCRLFSSYGFPARLLASTDDVI